MTQKTEKDDKDIQKASLAQEQAVRVTITGTNVSHMNKTCETLRGEYLKMEKPMRGPTVVPTRKLRITTRKTPCGEGSKTWHHYQMRIHKRYFDVFDTLENVRDLIKRLQMSNKDIRIVITQCHINDAKDIERIKKKLFKKPVRAEAIVA